MASKSEETAPPCPPPQKNTAYSLDQPLSHSLTRKQPPGPPVPSPPPATFPQRASASAPPRRPARAVPAPSPPCRSWRPAADPHPLGLFADDDAASDPGAPPIAHLHGREESLNWKNVMRLLSGNDTDFGTDEEALEAERALEDRERLEATQAALVEQGLTISSPSHAREAGDLFGMFAGTPPHRPHAWPAARAARPHSPADGGGASAQRPCTSEGRPPGGGGAEAARPGPGRPATAPSAPKAPPVVVTRPSIAEQVALGLSCVCVCVCVEVMCRFVGYLPCSRSLSPSLSATVCR